MAKELTHIEIHTQPNGYTLDVGKEGYFYLTREELIRGIIYHFGMGEKKAISNEETKNIINACIKWKENKELVKALAKTERELRALQGKYRQECNHSNKLEERIDELEGHAKRVTYKRGA